MVKFGYGFNIILNFITSNGNKTMNICWFTNIDNNKEQDLISLIKTYNPTDYPTYDNYDAINVNFIKDMPYDYDGVIGVPITALKYLCSDGLLHFDTPLKKKEITTYKIVGAMTTTKVTEDNFGYPYIKGKKIYARVLIQSIKL